MSDYEPTPVQESGDVRDNAEQWMADHPEAMALMEVWARSAARNSRPFGIALLTERLRWEFQVERGNQQFAVNNSYRAYIARELQRRIPALADVMRLRRTKYDGVAA